jgi:beta-xylosidase
LLHGDDADGVRAVTLPAAGRPHLLLRRDEVSLFVRLARRSRRAHRPGDVGSPQADAFTAPIAVAPGAIELRVDVDFERLYFSFKVDGGEWTRMPQMFDASILSDEATAPGLPNFTGAFVGMACHDMSGTGRHADFDWFEYVERPYCP